MNVGVVVYGGLDRTSGGYRYDRKLVSHLREAGDSVSVISIPDRGYGGRLTQGFSRSLRRRLANEYDVLIQDELCFPSLWRHNRKLDGPLLVSLVHLLRTPMLSRTSSLTSIPSGGSTLGRIRTGIGGARLSIDQRLSGALERRYLDSVDAAICTSRHTESALGCLLGAPESLSSPPSLPTLVAYPGGRRENISEQSRDFSTGNEPRNESTSPAGTITFVGNLEPRKGVHDLFDALERLLARSQRARNWRVNVVGSQEKRPAYARAIGQRAAELEPSMTLALTGRVSRPQLEQILAETDILAVPSYYESFGMVYLEAMEFGAVPVASSAGGASELVEDGVNGCLVEPGAPDQLADHLLRLVTAERYREELSAKALETAREHPNWEHSMARIRAFLLALLADETANQPGGVTGDSHQASGRIAGERG